MSIYLDYAAATPLDDQVLAAMQPYFSQKFYNASATYLAARAVRRDLEDLRQRAAMVLGARPAEIIFTSGATEANNLAITGVARKFAGAEILVSQIEHESVLAPAHAAGAKLIPVDDAGQVESATLENMLSDNTVLISIMLVNNEIGALQRLGAVAQIVKDVRADRRSRGIELPLYLHSDAAQAANCLDLHSGRLGVDMMSLNGGKIYGPKGAGLLFLKAGTSLAPLNLGGGQELGLRSGTENLASIAGLVQALETAQARRHQEAERLTELRHSLEAKISQLFPQARINGGKKRAPHILSVGFEGIDNETLMMQLDEAGFQVATGSACSASSDQPSQVLKALGLSDAAARSTLRISLGRQTTAPMIDEFIAALARLLPRQQTA